MRFDVWAPLAESSVALRLDGTAFAMAHDEFGWWSAEARRSGRRPVLLQARRRRATRRPPAHAAAGGSGGTGGDLRRRRTAGPTSWRGTRCRVQCMYEIHVGTFTAEGTLDAAIGHLDHLVSLGISWSN